LINKHTIYSIFILIVLTQQCFAENTENKNSDSLNSIHKRDFNNTNLAIGHGLSNGGYIGLQAAYRPLPALDFFVSIGVYEGNLPGINLGTKIYAIPMFKRFPVHPGLVFYYGTTGHLELDTSVSIDFVAVSYGFSIGGTTAFRFGPTKKFGFDIDIISRIGEKEIRKIKIEVIQNGNTYPAKLTPRIIIGVSFHAEFSLHRSSKKK